MTLTRFVERTTAIAAKLQHGEAGGSYLESYLLLSATLSGMASFLWPGPGHDRTRFVELWATLADPSLSPNRISLPLLVEDLEANQRSVEAKELKKLRSREFAETDLVVTGDDIDVDEAEVHSTCQSLTPKEVRKCSYPAIFYSIVRSNVVHEYELGEQVTPWEDAHQANGVSYDNLLIGRGYPFDSRRRIHFPVWWLIEIAKSIAKKVGSRSTPFPAPTRWWVDG